jgi:hypothetical protein
MQTLLQEEGPLSHKGVRQNIDLDQGQEASYCTFPSLEALEGEGLLQNIDLGQGQEASSRTFSADVGDQPDQKIRH